MNLIDAAWEGDVQRVRELIEAGVDVRFNNVEALRRAAYNGHIQIIELLLLAGADVHAKNDFALILAAHNDHTQVVELLLAAGADVHARNEEALRYAAINDHTQIIGLLLLAGANIEVLSLNNQQRFKHLVPTYISIQEYFMLELFIINIVEFVDRFIVNVVPDKKYVLLKMKF